MPTYTPADLAGMWAYLFVLGGGPPRGELLVEAFRAIAAPREGDDRHRPPPSPRERDEALAR